MTWGILIPFQSFLIGTAGTLLSFVAVLLCAFVWYNAVRKGGKLRYALAVVVSVFGMMVITYHPYVTINTQYEAKQDRAMSQKEKDSPGEIRNLNPQYNPSFAEQEKALQNQRDEAKKNTSLPQ